nr:Ig-like domain repeat protein [Curtobacterium pusillum]
MITGALPKLTDNSYGASSDWYDPTTGLPYKLTYGWVASTGGSTDVHEINQFTATSANGRTPVLAGTADVSDAKPQQGASGTYTVHPTTTTAGGAELGKVRISTTFENGVTPKAGTFTAGAYSCTTTGQKVVCTTPAALNVAAGSALPDLAIPYTSTAAIGTTVNATATIASTDALTTAPASAALVVQKVPTTTTASASSTQVTAGDTTTITANVVDGAGNKVPSGSVTFSEGTTVLCADVPVANGSASCADAVSTKGDHPVTVTYNGDATYAGSASSQTITATAKSTAFTIQASPAQIQYGQTSTVTVSGLPATATGNVTITQKDDSGQTSPFCTVPASAAKNPGCTTPTNFPAGGHTFTASYAGDETNAASTSQNVALVQVTKISTAPEVTVDGGSTATRTYGSSAPIATTGLPSDATGTVTYSIDGTELDTVPVGTGLSTPADLATGSHAVTVYYSGDATHSASTSTSAATLTVEKATTPITASASAAAPVHGDTVTFTTGGLPAGASGTVTFTDGTTVLCTATIVNQTASCAPATPLGTGTHAVTASWDGDSDHQAVTSTPVTVTVSKATSAIGATVQDARTASVAYGTAATFRATGLPSDADPTSAVTFVDAGEKTVATATAGDPTYTTSKDQPVGDLVLTAKWAGDADHTGSTALAVTLHVTKATLTITQTVDDSAQDTITHGQTAALATVGLPKGATGTVTYTGVDRNGKSVELGTGDASKSGAPVTTDEKLGAGDYTITAVWSGDDRYESATAATVDLVVTRAKPDLAGTVDGSSDHATTSYGTSVPVDVSGIPADATGTVDFSITTADGTAVFCIVTLPATSCTTPEQLPAGTYDVTATYSGDDDNAPNTTKSAVPLTIEKAVAPITLSASDDDPTYGAPITLTAGGLPADARGTVEFRDADGTLQCTGTISDGTATCDTEQPLAAGTHEVTATWTGDANHASVTSDAVAVTVAKATVTIDAAIDGHLALTVEYGTGATVTATRLPADADGDSVVTFTDGAGTIIGTATAAKPTLAIPTDQPVGDLDITATWEGDANHEPATADVVTLTVAKATVALTETVDQTSETTITHGDTATLEVDGIPKGATGTVTYTAVDANGVTTELGTGDAADTGAPVTTSKKLRTGAYTITAVYSGDDSHLTATAPEVRLFVAKATPQLAIGTAAPSTSYGTSTTVTVGGLPEDGQGTVTVTAKQGDTTVEVCTFNLPATTCATPVDLHAGEYELTATYSGDADHEVDTTAETTTLTVTKAATSVSVGDGSGTETSLGGTYGDPVTLPVSGLPTDATGTVEFQDEDGDTVCAVTLPATSCATPIDLPVGSHTVTPVYPGDADHAGSTGDPVTVVIAKAPTALTVAAGASHRWGSSTELTIGGLPEGATGSVVLSVNGAEICTIALPTSSCTTDVIEPGTVTVSATWGGDASYEGSSATTEATVSAIHTVNPTHVQSPSRTSGQLVWPAIQGAVSYQTTIATDQGLSKGVRTVTVHAPSTTSELDGLTAGTTYWYRVATVSASGTVLSTHDAVLVTAAAAAAATTPTSDPSAPTAAAPAPQGTLQVGQLAFTGPTVAVGMIGFGALLLMLAGALLLLARRLRDEQGPVGPLRKG